MANEQNLLRGNPATQFKSGRNAVENGRKGGIASGEVKKKKKTLQELAKIIAAAPVTDAKQKQKLQKVGVADEDMTQDALVMNALFNQALKGDVKAIEKWQELTSEETDNKVAMLKELLGDIGLIE